jgi:tetratricopeptide (TPR) repeat protein
MAHRSTRLAVSGAVLVCAPILVAAQAGSLSAREAVALYADHRFDAAVHSLDGSALTVAQFTGALDEWIATGDSPSRVQRRLVAAAFALDAVWAATRTPWNARRDNADPWQRVTPNEPARVQLHQFTSQPLVARWAFEQLPAPGTAASLVRTLWLTAVGVAQDGHAWHQLDREILPLALQRMPEEPRVRLAEAIARTNRELGPLREDASRRNDVLRIERLPPAIARRIPDAIAQFERLLGDPAIGGEAELRIGYLELRRSRWPEALARFDGAAARLSEPMLRAATHYLAGWVYEQLDRPEDAIAEYRQGQRSPGAA